MQEKKTHYLLSNYEMFHNINISFINWKNDKIHKNYVKLFLYSLDFPKRPSFVCPMSVEQRNSFWKCVILSSFMNHVSQNTIECNIS